MEEEEKDLSLGEYFKMEREKRDITLKEIEEKTKISAQILKFLEDDRIDLLPPRTFIRGFLQVIAKEFNMDEMTLLHYLEKTMGEPEQSLPSTVKARKKGLWWKVIILAVIIFFLAFLLKFCDSRDIKGHASIYDNATVQGITVTHSCASIPIPGMKV